MTQSQLSEIEIRQQILDGKTGPDGAIKMPAFRQTLKEDEIDALARYARSLQVKPPPRAGKGAKE